MKRQLTGSEVTSRGDVSSIPLVDLKAQYMSIKGAIDDAIGGVIARADFIQGQEVALFERDFAAFSGAKYAIGVSSGTEALRLALIACGIGQGDEVITTPFTFIATVEAIAQTGATPVFVDIDPHTCNLNPRRIEKAISERTRAILPIHLYGRPADMDPVLAVAKRYSLRVVEDAAQAHGATYKGRVAGTMGDAGCFSFYPAKNLGAFGDAGMVVTDDPEIADNIRLLRDHGRNDKYNHLCLGFNGRLDTLQAAVLRVKLASLAEWNERRREIAATYRRLLADQEIELPPDEDGADPVYHLFVVRTPERDRLCETLAAAGISAGIHFPVPLHLQPACRHLGYGPGDFPESERAAGEVLSLPIYPELTEDQVRRVAEVVAEALRGAAPLGALRS